MGVWLDGWGFHLQYNKMIIVESGRGLGLHGFLVIEALGKYCVHLFQPVPFCFREVGSGGGLKDGDSNILLKVVSCFLKVVLI